MTLNAAGAPVPPQTETEAATARRAYRPTGIVAVAPQALGMMLELCQPVSVETRGQVAIVRVTGPLAHHADVCMQDYGSIRAAWQGALKNRPAAIVLSIHSPGGDVAGMLDTATGMRADADAAGVPCYAHTAGTCASAAYALASAMAHVSASPSAQVGSIGVIAVLQNMAAAAAASGVETTVLTSGARKADGNPMLPMTDAARSALQAGVDALAAVYFAHVATYRAIDAAPLEAAMFVGRAAQETGLVDEIESLDALVARISAPQGAAGSGVSPGAKLDSQMADKASLRAALAAAAEEGDEDAKRALAAFDAKAGEEEDKDKDKDKDAKASKASKAEDDKDDKHCASHDDGDEKDKDASASASALSATVASLAAQVNALSAEKLANERNAFFAANPHIGPELRASFKDMPLAQVKSIVAALPKPAPNFAADLQATGTKGDAAGVSGELTYHSPQAKSLDMQMGLVATELAVEHGATTLTLGVRKPVAAKGSAK